MKLAALAAGAALLPVQAEAEPAAATAAGCFRATIRAGRRTWDAALAVLAGNVKTVPRYRAAGSVRRRRLPGHLAGVRTA